VVGEGWIGQHNDLIELSLVLRFVVRHNALCSITARVDFAIIAGLRVTIKKR
jgi:hypothetical protein